MSMPSKMRHRGSNAVALVLLLCAAYGLSGCPGKVAPQWRDEIMRQDADREPPAAVRAAEARVRREPTSASAHTVLAALYAQQGLPGLALAEFQAALNYDPEYVPAILGCAGVAVDHGDVQRALRLYRRAVLVMPNHPLAHHNLAQIHLSRRDFAAAQEEFQRAAELDPRNKDVWLGLITACLQGGRPERALRYAEQALRLLGDLSEIHANCGAALEALGKYAEAEEHYRTALRVEPTDPLPMNNLAYLYASTGRKPAEALRLARQATALGPHNAAFLDTLGYVLYRQRRCRSAAATLEEAKSLRPSSGVVRYHLGLVREALGEANEAAAELRIAVRLEPNAPWARDAERRRRRQSSVASAH